MNDRILTAVDASLNRALEGLRVCEDVCRFMLRDGLLSKNLKDVRHELAGLAAHFPRMELLRARNVAEDPIRQFNLADETTRTSARDIFTRNLHRAAEAIRSIEEFSKLGAGVSAGFQALRFRLYALEQDALFALGRGDIMSRFTNALYAICDPSFAGKDLVKAALGLADGGASIIQLRMKEFPAGEILPVAKEMAALCRERNIVFIVNDRPDIALCAGAHGVHLGQDDLPVSEARKALPPDMIIGVSTHSLEDARKEMESAPDYIAIGPVYDTSSKYGEPLRGIGVETAGRVAAETGLPVVAIGGIVPGRVAELAAAGVTCFAVMSYLYQGEVAGRCREFTGAIGIAGAS
jgi:thiamine-phosphate pyrophosphorylase